MGTAKELVDLFSGVLGPITAACVGYIAYRQWKSDDLEKSRKAIEKRIDINKVVSEHLSYIDRTLKVSQKHYDRFRIAHCEAKFYFPKSVDDFLDEIDISSHQWLLEDEYLRTSGMDGSIELSESLNQLMTCSGALDSKLGAYVMHNLNP